MRITLLIGSLSGGGAERVVCNLANYLSSHGHDITILTVSDEQTYSIDPQVKHIVLYGDSRSKLPHSIINVIRLYRMNRYLRKEKMDLYVTFLPKLTCILFQQKRLVKCPIILAERADPGVFCAESAHNKRAFNKYYRMADGYVFQTTDARKFYEDIGINVQNSVVIPNAINPTFVKRKHMCSKKNFVVGAGRLTEQKNFSLLIEGFAAISSSYPDYKLVIYGDGHLRQMLQKKAADSNIEEKVEFRGYVTDLADRLQEAAVFVLSSDYEGMPNVLIEAMALGLPVISTDCPVGGPRFLIEDGVNGSLVPVGDVQALSKKLNDYLSDPEKAGRMGGAAREISERLSYDRIYGQWEVFMERMVSETK